jgi:hypothetical protein
MVFVLRAAARQPGARFDPPRHGWEHRRETSCRKSKQPMHQPKHAASAESRQAELDELADRQRIARQMGGTHRLVVRERIDLC